MVYSREELLRDISKFLEYCKQCGFCTPVCPVLKVSDYVETYGPRGRLLQGRGVVEGGLRPRPELSSRIYCTLCGFCEVKCIAALKLTDLYLAVRHYLSDSGLIPEQVKQVSKAILGLNNPYNVEPSIKAMWLDYLPERPAERGKVLYWAGCTSAIRNPETASNAYQLIKELSGPEVAVIAEEPCCGWPLYLNGDVESYKEQLTKALNAIKKSGAEIVITTCPACTRSLREKAKELGIEHGLKIYHVVEYLHELLKAGRLPKFELEAVITYHDPCDLGRHLGRVKEPREVLNSIKGLKIVEMRGSGLESNCCGGGGLYQVMHMDRAYRIASLRLKDMPSNVRTLVTACPSCEMTLRTEVANEGLDVEVLDVVDLLMRARRPQS